MKLRVVHLGDPRLRVTSSPIPAVTDETRALARLMVDAMHDEGGVGLAAPQVGVNVRLAVLRLRTEGPGPEEVAVAVNPVLSDLSPDTIVGEEGCLSVPGVFGPVRRAASLTLTYQDLEGTTQVRELEDFDARIAQHEVDHLDGVLFIDRVEDKSTLFRARPGHEPSGAI